MTAYPDLARLALMALTRTTNNNNVESRWSLLTYRYHAHVQNATAEYLSAAFRQKDFETAGLTQLLKDESFLKVWHKARNFRRKNKPSITAVYRSRQEDAEEREIQSKKPLSIYPTSNIKDKAIKDKSAARGSGAAEARPESQKKQRKTAKAAAKRKSGAQMSRYECEDGSSESEPDSEESSITEESQWSDRLEESELEESDNGTLCDDEPDQDGSERESENLIEEDQCRISSAGEHSRSSVAVPMLLKRCGASGISRVLPRHTVYPSRTIKTFKTIINRKL